MTGLIIAHIIIGALNAVAACICLSVAGMTDVNRGEFNLVNILLGSINFLCAVYNIAWVTEMLNIA